MRDKILEAYMRIGEVCLNTNDVVKLANFYKQLFGIDNGSNDEVHQTLLSEETQLTIYNDGSKKNMVSANTVCPLLTVLPTMKNPSNALL